MPPLPASEGPPEGVIPPTNHSPLRVDRRRRSGTDHATKERFSRSRVEIMLMKIETCCNKKCGVKVNLL